MEWFVQFSSGSPTSCSKSSKRLFQAAVERGYTVYQPRLPLVKVESCQNRNYEKDLLLIRNDTDIDLDMV